MAADEGWLRTQIALGWIVDLLILTIVILFGTVRSVLTEAHNNFDHLRFDPGVVGLDILVWLFAFYALMPVLVSIISPLRWRVGRWVMVALAILNFLFNILHHMEHYSGGDRPNASSHVLDFTLHLIMLWVIVSSIRWARIPAPPRRSPVA